MGLSIQRAYGALGMTPLRYVLRYALPIAAMGAAVPLALDVLVPGLFDGALAMLRWLLPGFALAVALLFPYLLAESRKSEMNRNIHFYITDMGVLATANLSPLEIFRALGRKREYGALAAETERIVALVDAWNLGLSDAARFVAKRTPSEIFADFLDRCAYSLDTGEDLPTFLRNEQVVVLNDYAAFYKGALYEVDHMKDLFTSVMMAAVFIVIFAILMPVITGMDAGLLMGGAVFLAAFIAVTFIWFTKAKAPADPIWNASSERTALRRDLLRRIPASIALAAATAVALLLLTSWPSIVILAASFTPLLLVGLRVGRAEEELKRRDDSFAAFIRSLGASASANGGQLSESLKHLQHHDFGPLTENIRELYRRLSLRIDDEAAWRVFAADCGSNLIEKFGRMFHEGVRAGGRPDEIGRIISDNFVVIVNLRKSRYQTASGFRGLLYGLTGGMAFALFVGLAIVGMLGRILGSVPAGDAAVLGTLSADVDLFSLGWLVVAFLLALCLAASLMVAIASGGSAYRSWVDFVGMFWVAAFVSLVADSALTGLLV